jgi:hypothetical protein
MTDASVTTRSGAPSHAQRAPVAARLAALSRAVDGMRRRPQVDVRRALLVAGSTAMGLGLVAIVLGWYGAAHSAYQFQEIPYMISGGLLGVALVAGGGFLFFGAWIVRMIEENRKHAGRVERTLDRLDRALEAIATDAAAAAFTPASTNGSGADPVAAGAHGPARPERGTERGTEYGAGPGAGAGPGEGA